MLNILHYGEKYSSPVVLVLGGFDGLHLGHRELLAEAGKRGELAVTAVTGEKGKVLFTLPERAFLFGKAGVSLLYELPFTEEFKNTPPEEFLDKIFSCLNVSAVFCGEDFRFGKDAAGTPGLLTRLAPCPVTVKQTVKGAPEEGGMGRKYSTTLCKAALRAGDFARLNACLVPSEEEFTSGAYFVRGEVEHGREVGRTYGFPTLNLSVPPEKLLPPDGVYGGVCSTPEGEFPCILNLGARPTFASYQRKLEAFLDGFSGDLYGETVRVYPTEFYRGIEAFPSAEALKAQLQKDIERLRKNRR